MSLRLIQYSIEGSGRGVAALDGAVVPADGVAVARQVRGVTTTLELARLALAEGVSLAEAANARLSDIIHLDTPGLRLRAAIDHPDPAHLVLSGTGLTHLGSAKGRDAMHKGEAAGTMTDSLRMFRMGVEGGKPASGPGVQPEWFYKGDGLALVGPDEPLHMPDFAEDGGEEPEIAGIYLIDEHGQPQRLGFALANEFSDHVVEKENYLWLAHSKLRHAALGAELLTGPLPAHIEGRSRIWRDGTCIWEKGFLSGEANMSHFISNLEYHHFKYAGFRRPGDVHVHFFGTATLSFADGIRTQEGDRFEISADCFALPLTNSLAQARPEAVKIGIL